MRTSRLAPFALLLMPACSEGTAPDRPTSVILVSASVVREPLSDAVTVALSNEGGSGDFYLEFFGVRLTNVPGGCRVSAPGAGCPPGPQILVAESNPINVTASYRETLVYDIRDMVSSVRVHSRPTNTAIYSRTSCKVVRSYGAC